MRTTLTLFVMLLNLLIAVAIDARTVVDPSKGLTLRNNFVEFKFSPGGMGLESMTDLKTGYNHIRSVKGKHLLWEVVFGKGCGERPSRIIMRRVISYQ